MKRLLVMIVALAAACGSKEGDSSAPASAPAAAAEDPIAPVLAAWKSAGLDVGAFAPADAKSLGGKCQAGTVAGIDTTLCAYPDDGAAKGAEAAGLATVGDSTGLAVAQGKVLLVIADRKHADPSGKKLNDAVKSFRKN
jgi:hypothetical protein